MDFSTNTVEITPEVARDYLSEVHHYPYNKMQVTTNLEFNKI